MQRKIGILLCAAVLAASLTGCVSVGWQGDWGSGWHTGIQPSGTTENRAYTLGDFEALNVAIDSADVAVTLSPGEPGVTIEADTAYLDALDVAVNTGGTLKINSKNNTVGSVSVKVSVNDLSAIHVHGSTVVNGTGEFSGDELSVIASGASFVGLSGQYNRTSVNLSGDSELKMGGSSEEINIILSGSSEADTLDTAANVVMISASGASCAYVNAEDTLDVQASGSSDIEYTGSARVSSMETSGASSVRRKDN